MKKKKVTAVVSSKGACEAAGGYGIGMGATTFAGGVYLLIQMIRRVLDNRRRTVSSVSAGGTFVNIGPLTAAHIPRCLRNLPSLIARIQRWTRLMHIPGALFLMVYGFSMLLSGAVCFSRIFATPSSLGLPCAVVSRLDEGFGIVLIAVGYYMMLSIWRAHYERGGDDTRINRQTLVEVGEGGPEDPLTGIDHIRSEDDDSNGASPS